MSPSSSIPSTVPLRRASHSRHNSTALQTSKASSPAPSPASLKANVHYTCFVRLPFVRNGFEDPPLVEWNATKDKALWKVISKTSNTKDLDWQLMSTKFDVSLPFLLQQAAWLYERHFDSMRKQMQKLAVPSAPSPPPPDSETSPATVVGTPSGDATTQRLGSKEARRPSLIGARKDLPTQAGESSIPGTPRSTGVTISRTPSTTTVTQSRMLASSGKQPVTRAFRGSSSSQRRPIPPARPVESSQDDDESAVDQEQGSGESDSEDEPPIMARSQAYRRPPPSRKPALQTLSSDGDAEQDDDEDSSGGYLPFAAALKGNKVEAPAAPLATASRKSQPPIQRPVTATKRENIEDETLPADSSASSASSARPQLSDQSGVRAQKPGPLSPKHKAQLTSLSPRYRKDGSEDSPSIGSSFSDLDGDSVTRSALEDALLSNMQHGSMASRLGSLREALGRK